jgi:hypothetical protein
MTLVLDTLRTLLPYKRKQTPSGWISFNAPCCHHRGHKSDDRLRGGVTFNEGFVYHCFNCGFSTGWQPGRPISFKLRELCSWLGASDDTIKRLIFEALKTERPDYVNQHYTPPVEFTKKELPEGSLPLIEWMQEKLDVETEQKILLVIQYLIDRGFNPLAENFYWSPLAGYDNRVIIPFLYHGQTVGSTARRITPGKPKYLSDQHPNFVFNMDAQANDRKYVIVCEGPFDALAIGGVALLTNEISEQHARIINSLSRQVIFVPDQDKAGIAGIDKARELGWSVAFPNWNSSIKDCADAVKEYGKMFTIVDIIKTSVSGNIKINLMKNQMIKRIKNVQTN